jgi:hypothetical protein
VRDTPSAGQLERSGPHRKYFQLHLPCWIFPIRWPHDWYKSYLQLETYLSPENGFPVRSTSSSPNQAWLLSHTSPLAGVRVSPLRLGAMSIGDKWHKLGMGSMDKQSSFKLLDAYFDAGPGVRRLSLLSRDVIL